MNFFILKVMSVAFGRMPSSSRMAKLGLLQHKHEVVEELLEPLVGEVNADLLEPVVLEVLEASNIQDINEVDSLQLLDMTTSQEKAAFDRAWIE